MIDYLKETIDGKRHSGYARTVELQKKYTKWYTGKGLNKDLRQFRKSESYRDYQERVRITNHIVPRIVKECANSYSEAYRNNNIQIQIEAEKKQLEKINKVMNEYNGFDSLDEYWQEKYKQLCFTDPNAWIIPFFYREQEETFCYPVIINSEKMLNYGMKNNKVEWFCFEQDNEFYLIKENYFAKAVKVKDNLSIINASQEEVRDDYGNVVSRSQYIKDKNGNRYIVMESEIYPYKDNLIVRIGYKEEEKNIKVSALEDAEADIKRLVNLFSEYDVNLLSHVFLQSYEYSQKCQNSQCQNGYLLNGEMCPRCHGTSFEPSSSSGMDLQKLPLPDNIDEMIDLSKMKQYVKLPVEVLEKQKDEIKDTIKNIRLTVLGSDIFAREEMTQAATATQILSNDQNKNNNLYAFAIGYCKTYQFQIEKIADIIEVDVAVSYWIDKSMVKESVPAMMKKITEAQSGGVPYGIVADLYDELANVIYANNLLAKKKHSLRKELDYCYGMSKEQRAAAILQMPENSIVKIQTIYYNKIIEDLLRENEVFFEFSKEKQGKLVEAKTKDYIDLFKRNSENINIFED